MFMSESIQEVAEKNLNILANLQVKNSEHFKKHLEKIRTQFRNSEHKKKKKNMQKHCGRIIIMK